MTAEQVQIRRDTATNLTAATPATGELGWDTTNSRLVVGNGTTAGGVKVTMAKDHQNQSYIYPTVGGTGDAITLTTAPAVAAYAAGQKFTFKAGAANTTATTVNVSGLGAKDVKKMRNGALAALIANDIISGGVYDIIYDGTQFQVKGLAEGPFVSGALQYLGAATASSSATIDLTSLMSSTYDDYMIMLENVIPATSTANLILRASTDNSTFDSGATYYYRNIISTTSTTVSADAASGSSSLNVCPNVSNNTAYGISGTIWLRNVNTTSTYRYITGDMAYHDGSSGNIATYRVNGEWQNTANAMQAVRLLFSSGAVASGVFRVYGVTKA